jgi:hypothetical protein
MNSRTGKFLRGGRRRILVMDRAGNYKKVQWRVGPGDWRLTTPGKLVSLYY